MVKVGIIGGSGVYNTKLLKNEEKIKINTPYGPTSDLVTTGTINGVNVVFIPRHGSKHTINPTNVNYRANIWALKELGVTHIIASNAVGSLREEYKPGDLVFPDQFIDRTTKRISTFYEGNKVAHISVAEPFCINLNKLLSSKAKEARFRYHNKGCAIIIEGPRFSTKAESKMFQNWGGDIIGMTTVPECVLAREAGICYASIGMVTDYDVWKEGDEVSTKKLIDTMKQNVEKVKKIITESINEIEKLDNTCGCKDAINQAFM